MEQAVDGRAILRGDRAFRSVSSLFGAPSRIDGRDGDGLAAPAAPFGVELAQVVLDHLHFGVAVFGPGTRLLFINRAGLDECGRVPGVRIEQGVLRVLEERPRNDFLRTLRAARDGVWSLIQISHGAQRLVLGLRPASSEPSPSDAPVLATFGIRSPSDPLSIHFFARSCGLSPAEANVVRRLSEGLSPKEIARRNDVALSTVRTQLRCVRTKTGARNITDLVRTVGCLPPMMTAGVGVVRGAAAA